MEGPSLVIATEEMAPFIGKKVVEAGGAAKIDFARLTGRKLTAVRSWGKHWLLGFGDHWLRVHFLMFGSYRIDERREGREPKLSLRFKNGELNIYSSAVSPLAELPDNIYDWRTDVMAPEWEARHAARRVRALPDAMVCDVLMNQTIFSGVGNIIKNEVLYRLRLHPEARVSSLAPREVSRLVKEAHAYSHQFYAWKKASELRRHWLIFKKRKCPTCQGPVSLAKTGKGARRSFWCPACQPFCSRPSQPTRPRRLALSPPSRG